MVREIATKEAGRRFRKSLFVITMNLNFYHEVRGCLLKDLNQEANSH